MPQVEFFTNFDDFDTFEEFKKDFRKKVIETGLDDSLIVSAENLKATLSQTVNEKITMNGQTPITSENVNTQQQNGLNQATVDIPKSEEELVKFLTDGKSDPSKYNKAKDYTTLSESGIVFGYGSRGQASSNRVTLRMNIEDGETVNSQYLKAKQFFQESLFALPDAAGNMNYYVNPGLDISQYVKIKCSVFTGDGSSRTKKGVSPQERFNINASKKGYADWTLKQEAVDMIKKNFINITSVMNMLKEGDVDRAKIMLDSADKNHSAPKLAVQLNKLKSNVDAYSKFFQDSQGRWRVKSGSSEGGRYATIKEMAEAGINPTSTISVSMQAYQNAVQLISNLKIVKKITNEAVLYTLVSSFADFDSNQVDFYKEIMNAIRGWGVENEDDWFDSLVTKTEELIRIYESNE